MCPFEAEGTSCSLIINELAQGFTFDYFLFEQFLNIMRLDLTLAKVEKGSRMEEGYNFT